MKVVVAGHITIDTIVHESYTITSLGGPPCYAGLTAKNLGADVLALTKVGYDFPDEYAVWISRVGIELCKGVRSAKPTTRFRIVYHGNRSLTLTSRCEDLDPSQIVGYSGDGIIINPVANEVSRELLSLCIERFRPAFLDPQGFLRGFLKDGSCYLHGIDVELLKGIDFVKMDEEEAYHITGMRDLIGALRAVHRLGVKGAIATRPKEVFFSDSKHVYRIKNIGVKRTADTTGRGDILGGAFFYAYLREQDPVWAVCVGLAASSLLQNKFALSKIPVKEEVLRRAEELKEKVIRVEDL